MTPLAEIRSLISRHCRMDGHVTPIPGVTFAATSAPNRTFNAIYKPGVALIAQGAKRTVVGNKAFEYHAGQYLVVPVSLPVVARVIRASHAEPYLVFTLTLDPAAIAALLLETAADNRRLVESTGLAVSDASTELLDAVLRLIRLIDHPNDIAVLGPMLKREILWRLLSGEQGAIVRQIGLEHSHISRISRAIEQIRANYARSLSIEELAQVAGMSSSSFHRHFRAVTAMSPLQYQKQIRLQEARTRLITEARDVAAVGFDVGYDNPSQFNREYSRLFGVSPGKDVKRLRSESLLTDP